jgi:hypothetical protein
MKEYRPVEVPGGSFGFCKYTIAALLWLSLVLRSGELLLFCFAILALSAALGVRRAPLVVLWTRTADRLFPSSPVILDENAVRFAHIVGAVISLLALVLLHYFHPVAGWITVGALALLKTSGAAGFCGAMKLWSCLNNPNGTCCRVGKRIKKSRSFRGAAAGEGGEGGFAR